MTDNDDGLTDYVIDLMVFGLIISLEPFIKVIELFVWVIHKWIDLSRERYESYKASKIMREYGE